MARLYLASSFPIRLAVKVQSFYSNYGVITAKIITVHASDLTKVIQAFLLSANGINFKLIDTSGFDDTDVEEADIVEALATWLEKSYCDSQRLKGLLYLHKMIDNRQKGSELRNLRVFRELCCDENFKQRNSWYRLVVTRARNYRKSSEKIPRETLEFWGEMISKGSQVVRAPLDRFECIQLLLDIAQSM